MRGLVSFIALSLAEWVKSGDEHTARLARDRIASRQRLRPAVDYQRERIGIQGDAISGIAIRLDLVGSDFRPR
jgi:hypothetical protein